MPAGDAGRAPQLLDLPWRDVLFEHVLPRLSLPDLLSLRQASVASRQLVEQYCSLMRRLDARHAFEQSGGRYRLDCAGFRALTRASGRLRLLRFHDQHGWLTDSLLIPVLRANCQLSAVYLDQSHWLTDNAMRALTASCPQLTVLSLRDCHWLSNGALQLIGDAWPRLRQLDLACCWQIEDSGLARLLLGCARLERLCVAKCYGLTDESLLSLRHNAGPLTDLDIAGCWRVTDRLLEQLSEFCRSLSRLCVRECSGVSLAAIDMLHRKRIATGLAPPAALRFLQVSAGCYMPPRLNVQI